MTREELEAKYSTLLTDCYDFSPPNGWLDLVAELFRELEPWPEVRVLQAKQKFGLLRVYIVGPLEAMDLVIEYERRSGSVCEVCGAPGTRRHGGWIVTACDAHAPLEAA